MCKILNKLRKKYFWLLILCDVIPDLNDDFNSLLIVNKEMTEFQLNMYLINRNQNMFKIIKVSKWMMIKSKLSYHNSIYSISVDVTVI